MKMSHHFISLWYPLKLGTFLISEDPPPNFELFPTETWDFFDFFQPPTPPIWTNSQVSLLFRLESFPYVVVVEKQLCVLRNYCSADKKQLELTRDLL